MANDLHSPAEVSPAPAPAEPGLAATVKGIVDDALELLKQQFLILKVELRSDFHRLLAGVIPIVCGVAPILLGLLMLCFSLVHLIHWATLPAEPVYDPAVLPLWACYLIVSAAFLVTGGILLGIGYYRLKTAPPVPEETAKALEENLQWLMNQNPTRK